MSGAEIVARRRKWTTKEKEALLAEVEAEGGRVSVVARRHGISDMGLRISRSIIESHNGLMGGRHPWARCHLPCEPARRPEGLPDQHSCQNRAERLSP